MIGYGIILYNETPSKLTLSLDLTPGHGDIFIDGLVTEEFEPTFARALSAVCDLIDLGELPETDFSCLDLNFTLRHSIPDVPVAGDSYGLLLATTLALGLIGEEPVPELCITGTLGENNRILPVGGIFAKRRGAKTLGFSKIMLPTAQLDFFERDIDQLPVESFYEAWTVVNYE